MYSVEDLLISHGYKISSNNNVPSSHTLSSSSREQHPPACSNSRCESTEKQTGHGKVNGYKADCIYGSGVKPTSSKHGPSNRENSDKNQKREEDNANIVDGHFPGGNLTSNSGFQDAHKEMHNYRRTDHDASHWQRRSQDLNLLMDYVDNREPHIKQLATHNKAEGMQRRPESALTTEEHHRQRQRRAESARARERELALYHWKVAAERKYQSLGAEEWHPFVGISRHMSESEGEKWAQEQQRPRTAEGAVPPRTKAKSQSLPRMAIPSDSIQYFSISSSGQDPRGSYRTNGHQPRVPQVRHLSEGEIRERWTDNSRSGIHCAPSSKPRFSRPIRPPSYEVHQQMRGSSEMLSGDFVPHPRDRNPLPFSRQDYFAQELAGPSMEPPGYIPPPSYRRQPVSRGGHRTYANSMGNYQYRGDTYMPAMAEVQDWFMRQTGMGWSDNYRDGRRSMPCRRQAYPVYGEDHIGYVQYIPFDDPRVRHMSGGRMNENSITDTDKIRNIRKDNHISTSEISPDDSAFLFSGKLLGSTEASQSNITGGVNKAVMQKEASGEVIKSKSLNDENCNRYPASIDYPNDLQTTSLLQTPSINQQFSETVTQVKTFKAQTAAENKKNKKKVKETMFCLVSVPINKAANKEDTDPNNNKNVSSSVVVPTGNSITHLHSKDIPKNVNISEHLTEPSSSLNETRTKRAPIQKEIIDAWSLQAHADKDLCFAGSWPGDQYKNQEFQTCFLDGSRNTTSKYPQILKATYDNLLSNDLGNECSVNYKCPIKVQNNFNRSRNSEFSQKITASSSTIKSPVRLITTPSSPDHQTPLRKSAPKHQAPNGQEAFGQFLLKPVNRRPWDAIGELESFNKDQNAKLQTTDQATEELDEALRNILKVDNTSTEFIRPELATNSVTEQYAGIRLVQQPNNDNLDFRPDFEHRGITQLDKHFREAGNMFSTMTEVFVNPDTPQRKEVNSDYASDEIFSMMQDNLRLDIPVPTESLLMDVGLTVYTAIPDSVKLESSIDLSPVSPMLTSPSENSETCEALQIASPDHTENSNTITGSERSPQTCGIRRDHFTFMAKYNDDDDEDGLYLSRDKTIADEHLEALLSQEKAYSLPTEDLSTLYQIQCAKEIPAHESLEQRAARILGIDVPADALVDSQDGGKELTKKGEVPEKKDTAIAEDHGFTQDKYSKESHIASFVLELPEFPPNKLHLSLPMTEDEDLSLSVCGGEKKVAPAPDMSEGRMDKSIVYHPVSVCRNEEMSAERINPTVEDESMSCVSGFKKEIQKGRAEEKIGKERAENRVQEDSVVEGQDEQFVINEMRVNEWQAVFEDVDTDKKKDEKEVTENEMEEIECTIQAPQSMGCSGTMPQSRSGTVVKREIRLPDSFNMATDSEDDDIQPVSDSYDPSRVERV